MGAASSRDRFLGNVAPRRALHNAPMTRPTPAAKTLHLVDASLFVFRARHSMPDQWHDADGWPVNAVHGFACFLLELLERERLRHIAIAFDEALDSRFRNALYPQYKANCPPAPDELKRQFAYCKGLCARRSACTRWRTANTKPTT